jgi:uncharacterized protein (TIGR02271 family)
VTQNQFGAAETEYVEVAQPIAIPADHPAYPTLKLLAEELDVAKREVEAGKVQVARTTETFTKPVDLELRRTRAAVDRVPVNRPVDSIPAVRQEGNEIIIPVVEEQVEVIRRLILKEEVHIRLEEETERYHDDVELRRQDIKVSQVPSEFIATERSLADG